MRIGWATAPTRNRTMMARPTIPTVFWRNKPQVLERPRRARVRRMRQYGWETTGGASVSTGRVGSVSISGQPYPGVEHGVQQVGDEVADECHDSDDRQPAHHQGDVVGVDAVEDQQSHTGPREDRL